MSESKHTPGPWYIVGHTILMPDDRLGGIAVAKACSPRGDYREADARLIAAAPDLLAACEAALAALAPSFDRLDHASLAEAENALRAAIAKAKGET